jgi:hypothetical protein
MAVGPRPRPVADDGVMAVQRIQFERRPSEAAATELVAVVDGVSLVLVRAFEVSSGYRPAGGYRGLVLDYFNFGDLARYLAGEQDPWPGSEVPLLGCDCGEWGCWPLIATVAHADGLVEWSSFRQPHRPTWDYSGFGPFRFAETDYRSAARAARDRAPSA